MQAETSHGPGWETPESAAQMKLYLEKQLAHLSALAQEFVQSLDTQSPPDSHQ